MFYVFLKASLPILFHFTVVFTLTYIKKLNILEFLGLNFSLICTLYFLNKLVCFVYNTWLGVKLGHNVDLRKMGSWAVVTGATDGIGLAYTRQLARRGINIVLMSRSLDRLEKCAEDLEAEFAIKTKVIDVDFTGGMEIYDRIETELSGMDIGTLVNNVGMTYSKPTYFDDLKDSKKFIHDMININVLTVTMMTRIVIPQMLMNGKGVIVNVGSMASLGGAPWMTLYSATKSYMDRFTQDLAIEYKDRGIIFQYLSPGYVTTKLSKIRNPTFWTPSPDQFAELAVKSIGLQDVSSVWLPHRAMSPIYQWLELFFPESMKSGWGILMKSFWLFGIKREMQKMGVADFK